MATPSKSPIQELHKHEEKTRSISESFLLKVLLLDCSAFVAEGILFYF
jgi:hypothetical protein